MKWTRWYIIIMVALVVLYMIAEYNRPKVIDWRPTYSNRDKIPYGTYIVYNEMKAFFDGLKPKEMREPFYNHVNNSEETGGIYFFINGWFDCTNEDVDELYNFISAGNTVFIAAERYADTFINKFKVDAEWYLDSASGMSDSTSINFASPALRTRRGHVLEKNTLEGYFSRIDTANTAVLGNNNHGKPNFIKTTIGDGKLYLHAVPRAFTNIFILKNDNASYINKVFSHLPKNPSAIYWDEFAKQGRGGPDTPLRVILTRPELKWAYYLALAGM
ncbi:MAG: DUF4350 domain-containing protein, partial [Gemmatimonadaceae bacterium]|nr:DUF4350 domain-containing protein [Chitinophagaceae bacterium]